MPPNSYIFLLFLIFIIKISTGQGQYCNETRRFLVKIKVPETYKIQESYRNALGRQKWRQKELTRQVDKFDYETKIIRVCCKGYKRKGGECIPVCEKSCLNGKCTGPNQCTCDEGYEYLTLFKCKPKCDNCDHGLCVAPGVCNCYPDFAKSTNGTCTPICQSECVNGYCSAPDVCSCYSGYYLNETEIETDFGTTTIGPQIICQPHCNENCLNGYCSAPNVCSCNDGFEMNNNNECVPTCSGGCKNGVCIDRDLCICMPGYEKNEDTEECEPICSYGCINGNCTNPEICTCNDGFKMQENSVSQCEPHCDPQCEYGEFCNAPNECRCAVGYQKNIETNKCEPKCSPRCINANCTNPMYCECWEGFEKNEFTPHLCHPICSECELPRCIAPNTCYTIETTTDSIIFENTATDSISFQHDDEHKDPSTISFDYNFDGTSESIFESTLRSPRNWNDNTCDSNCTNGICLNGKCYCNDGYSGLNCPSFCSEIDCPDGYFYDYNENCTCFTFSIDNEIDFNNTCNNTCPEYSVCVLPNQCDCNEGFERNAIGFCVPSCVDIFEYSNSNLSISNGCINGTCIAPNVCQCNDPNMIANPLNKFECIEKTIKKTDNGVSKDLIRSDEFTRNMWFICLAMLILAAIIFLSTFIYKKRKDYNVDRKEKEFGCYQYKDGTLYFDEVN